MLKRNLLPLLVLALVLAAHTDGVARPATNTDRLEELSSEFRARWEAYDTPALRNLLTRPSAAQAALNRDPGLQVIYINESGFPVAFTVDNLNAARSLSTYDVHPGGSAGFGIDGSSTQAGELGIWDGGGVLFTHLEFAGRVTQMDSPGGANFHATHVAGTLIASGAGSGSVRGMSPQALLDAYDWNSDDAEMATAGANGMLVSNHSYGFATGWRYDSGVSAWYWWGDIGISETEDFGFGYYGDNAQAWDNIAFNAPYYTIVKSAGNDRNDLGPTPGGQHFFWDDTGWAPSTVVREPDCGSDGYDCVSWSGTAKNIITVGAVNDLTSGYISPAGVVMSSFSAWGPTDDGRIKPDIVGNGINLTSSGDGGINDYITLSGTSMSSPNVAGSINLVYQYFEASHDGLTPLASTVKALVIQTADEAGPNPGPDYMFGWGLMNTRKALEAAQNDSAGTDAIVEAELLPGDAHVYQVEAEDGLPLRVTIAWTDPPGNPATPQLNPTDLMLVNDLDMRIEHLAAATVYEPYILDPANPALAAANGDNFRDNVEQVHIDAPAAGVYAVTVTHKGELTNSLQTYSLVSSAPQWAPCCGQFTNGQTGNFNNDPEGVRDLNDVLDLASYAFLSGPAPDCLANGNVSGDSECTIDLDDVLSLASYSFLGGVQPADCLLSCE